MHLNIWFHISVNLSLKNGSMGLGMMPRRSHYATYRERYKNIRNVSKQGAVQLSIQLRATNSDSNIAPAMPSARVIVVHYNHNEYRRAYSTRARLLKSEVEILCSNKSLPVLREAIRCYFISEAIEVTREGRKNCLFI
jgi:hypothetical protein